MKILNKIKKIFKKKEQSKVLYYSKPKKVVKKRKHIKISLEFLKHFEFLRKRYIPYLFILFTFFIIITIVLIL
jgi:hypothetical protein